MNEQLLIGTLELAALLAFALSGIAKGLRRRMDVVGLITVAFVTAFGGGTLRDVLLDRRPFVWVERVEFVWLVLGLVLVALPLTLRLRGRGQPPAGPAESDRMRARFDRWTGVALRQADAVGLGLFTVSGVTLSLDAGMPATIAAIMGVITATFGGVLRDLLCAELPAVLSDHRPYAICSFAGAWICIGTQKWLMAPAWQAALAGAAIATLLRLLALARDWRLPALVTSAAAPDDDA